MPQRPEKRCRQIFQEVHKIASFFPRINSIHLGASKLIQTFLPDLCEQMKLHPGRQIYVKESKDAFLTSELFENPLVVWRTDKKNLIVPCKENIDEGKYFHR